MCRSRQGAGSRFPERATIFTDTQAAIRRGLGAVWPGQMYALQARKHIAVLRRARPDITIEIRWCPAHKGVPGNQSIAPLHGKRIDFEAMGQRGR